MNEIAAQVNALKVFPNPACGVVGVNIELVHEASLEITIYDAMARRLKIIRKDFSSRGKHEMKIADAGEFLPGNYFLKVTSADGKYSSCRFTVE